MGRENCGKYIRTSFNSIKGHTYEEFYAPDIARKIRKAVLRAKKDSIPSNKIPRETRYCLCGCGYLIVVPINSNWNFKSGHNSRMVAYRNQEGLKKGRIGPPAIKGKTKETCEFVKRQANKLSALWKTDEFVRKQMLSRKLKPNKTEQFLTKVIQGLLPNEYKYTGDGDVIIGGCNPDWTNVNGQKKCIELFGDYYHQGDDPADRINHFKKYGWCCLVIWEHELQDLLKVKQQILEFNRKEN